MKKRFNKNTFSCGGTRSVVLFFIMMIGFVICCVNLFVINIDNQAEVVDMNTSKSLVLGESRGIIYDCKLKRLVAADYDYVCAVKPDVNSAEVLRNVLDADAYVNVVNQISKGNPVKFVSPYFVSHDDIVCEKIYKRYNNSQLASHLIGYVDYKNNGGCVFICTHDVELATEVADRVIVLSQGQIIADAPTNEVLSDRQLLQAGGLTASSLLDVCQEINVPPCIAAEEVKCYVSTSVVGRH